MKAGLILLSRSFPERFGGAPLKKTSFPFTSETIASYRIASSADGPGFTCLANSLSTQVSRRIRPTWKTSFSARFTVGADAPMLRQVFAFELRYWLRSWMLWIFFLLIATMVFFATATDH